MNEKRDVAELERNPAAEPQPVLVEIEGVQCMAYQDCSGKWRRFYNLELLTGEVKVVTSN